MSDTRHAIARRRATLLGALVILAAVLVLVLRGGGGPGRLLPGGAGAGGTFDPLSYSPDRASTLEQAAADGLAHVIYAKSPGGVLAAARRTAAFRPLVDAAARSGPLDADTLEAIVMLESAGRPDLVAGADPSAAAGLTQIVAQTGSGVSGPRAVDRATRSWRRRSPRWPRPSAA